MFRKGEIVESDRDDFYIRLRVVSVEDYGKLFTGEVLDYKGKKSTMHHLFKVGEIEPRWPSKIFTVFDQTRSLEEVFIKSINLLEACLKKET